jgi:hypothetical protein
MAATHLAGPADQVPGAIKRGIFVVPAEIHMQLLLIWLQHMQEAGQDLKVEVNAVQQRDSEPRACFTDGQLWLVAEWHTP